MQRTTRPARLIVRQCLALQTREATGYCAKHDVSDAHWSGSDWMMRHVQSHAGQGRRDVVTCDATSSFDLRENRTWRVTSNVNKFEFFKPGLHCFSVLSKSFFTLEKFNVWCFLINRWESRGSSCITVHVTCTFLLYVMQKKTKDGWSLQVEIWPLSQLDSH